MMDKTFATGPTGEYRIQTDSSDRPRKRKAMDDEEEDEYEQNISTYKKSKLNVNDQPELCRALSASQINKDPTVLRTRKSREMADKDLMPPPAAPSPHKSPYHHPRRPNRASLESIDSHSDAQTQQTRLTESDEYDMEAARQKAATIELPPNSGTWEPAERELFYHLAHRGFEPLLSKTWMTDFPTLPLSLYTEHSDQNPLIQVHRSNDFRGIRALRELFDTGKAVRDCVLSTNTESRSEPIIERATKKYIKWGLKDLGISSKQCIPVHTIVSMQRGQTTQDTIRDLTLKMHKLSTRHREACNVLTSIEHETQPDQTTDETRLTSDTSDHNLPIIYGLMICSSLLAVFTLSSHTAPPAFVVRTLSKQPQPQVNNADDANEDSGLRFIASFDFSDGATDVWNAFVVAIVAMMVRTSLAEVYDIPVAGEMDVDDSVLESSMLDGEYGFGERYAARYGAADVPLFLRHRLQDLHEVDDPDL